MSIADKLTTIAENVQKVYDAGLEAGKAEGGYTEGYEAGQKAEHDRFWDEVQKNGKRTWYEYAFWHWGAEYLRPRYKIVPSGCRDLGMFGNNPNLKRVEKEHFDLSQVSVAFGSNSTSAHYNLFVNCASLEVVEDIGLQAAGYYRTFWGCSKLHTIEVIRVSEESAFNNLFGDCFELTNITIEGTIGQSSFNVSQCTKLSHDSLMSIINALKDGASNTITLGTQNLAKLTDAEKALATQKGWTLA